MTSLICLYAPVFPKTHCSIKFVDLPVNFINPDMINRLNNAIVEKLHLMFLL